MKLTKADKRSIKYFLYRLNGFLEADQLHIGEFGRTLKRFEKRFDPKIGVLDFKYFDEIRLIKSGKERSAAFWINMQGRFIYIEYFAMHGKEGGYLGTIEFTQDLTQLRKLEGDQRLLSYTKKE